MRATIRDLLALLSALIVLTLALQLMLRTLTPIEIPLDDVYITSCLVLLIAHVSRLRLRERRAHRKDLP